MNQEQTLHEKIDCMLDVHRTVYREKSRAFLIKHAHEFREAISTSSGALARWTPKESTGRSPQDTYIVTHAAQEETIDWTSPNNNPLVPEVFDNLLNSALAQLERAERLYTLTRILGSRAAYALPIQLISDHAFPALFFDTMFRPIVHDLEHSIFARNPWKIIVLPMHAVQGEQYAESLRKKNGAFSQLIIAMDMERATCLVMGSQYCGTIKKTMFTVMNYLLPTQGILPLHASAIIDNRGASALLLGLSGTGKTTLSNSPTYLCIGDDEHAWSTEGIGNLENGCYAKLIGLDKEKEPEIYHALFDTRLPEENGCIIENAMVYPNGSFDLVDARYTENSRGSFPIAFLSKKKEDGCGGHPRTILFLTADAHGVLPPIARLTKEQTLFWFLMGYTCKLAGTETGITTPVTTFSRFFGQPFMPRQPMDYLTLFERYLDTYTPTVYLINTGWTGGPYGTGKRMDIRLTRALVDAALSGALAPSAYNSDPYFHILIPNTAPEIDPHMLNPRSTWPDPVSYDARARLLAQEFRNHFEKEFAASVPDGRIRAACPVV